MIKIADIIIKRRRELNITQEELASRLGVSAQAVSNWERKVGYPDLLLIPSLSNALGVSADELFGINGLSDSEILLQFRAELNKLTSIREQKECLRRYYHRYPNTYPLLERIAWIIYREYRDDAKMLDLAKELCRRIIDECTDTSVRITAVKVLAFTCGDDEALEYIESFDDRVLIKPNIIGRRLWDKKEYEASHDYFDLEMVLLFRYIIGRGSYCEGVPDRAIKWNKLLTDLLETVGGGGVSDGWLGQYGLTIIRLAAAYFAVGNKVEGYAALEQALSIYEKWYSFPSNQRLSVGRLSLFGRVSSVRTDGNSVIYIGEDEYKSYGIWEENISVPLTSESGWSWFDSVRNEERFIGIVNKALELEEKYNVMQS